MKAQQGMGKLKQLLKQADNAARLDACKSELQESLRVFQVFSQKIVLRHLI
jgi:hypothetical protein